MMRALALLVFLVLSPVAHGHEVRPAYLELKETAPGLFAVTWKQPVSGELRLALAPVLPDGCRSDGDRATELLGGASIERWRVQCDGGLKGRTVRIAGIDRTLTSVYVRAVWLDGTESSGLCSAAAAAVTLGPDAPPAVARYVRIGVEHILAGYDHIAFVAGLVLVVSGLRRLALALTAFTLAHSITLGAAALGIVGLPGPPVEACIALSIVLVGLEAVRATRGMSGLAATRPWLLAFLFGLLHGFGFAGALGDIGLPDNARVAALLLFNVGVEIGQLLVVAVLLLAMRALSWAALQPDRVRLAGGYALGGLGAFWLIQRVAGFFTA